MKYELTLKELGKLCRDFQVDCFDGFVSNDNAYIELWMKKNTKQIEKDNCDALGEQIK